MSYRESGTVKKVRTDEVVEYWTKNHFPLGWNNMSPSVFKVALDAANKAYSSKQNEEDATKIGMEAAEKYAEEHSISVFST